MNFIKWPNTKSNWTSEVNIGCKVYVTVEIKKHLEGLRILMHTTVARNVELRFITWSFKMSVAKQFRELNSFRICKIAVTQQIIISHYR
jgi:hypothetical protein